MVKAALGLLEKLTLEPNGVTAEDIQRVPAAGVRDAAIEDAMKLEARHY
jgi:alkylhydroperoxidase family enzyme